MTTARFALILITLLTGATAVLAQPAPGRVDNGVVLSPSDSPVAAARPKPGKLLLDLLQAIAKPGEQPAAPPPTLPIDPNEPIGSAPALDPAIVPPPVAVVAPRPKQVAIKAAPVKPPPPRTRPVAIKADPVPPPPPQPMPREPEVSLPPTPPGMEAPKLPPAIAPVEATLLPPPPIHALANDPPVEPHRALRWLWLAAALVTALAVASTFHLRRVRRIARTKAALSLAPRIDRSGSGAAALDLAFSKPAVAIRARLEELAHG